MRTSHTSRWAATALLVITTAAFLFPVYWAVVVAVENDDDRRQLPPRWFPSHVDWSNFSLAWHSAPFQSYILHTIVLVIVVTIGAVGSSAIVAYGLARVRFPGRDLLFNVMLATIMVPFIVTLIPIYLLFNQIHWLDTYYPLIVPAFFGGGPFNIFLLRQFMLGIPRDIDEAAMIDGAGHLRIFVSIILPVITPALAVTAWMTAVATWSDFLGPMIFLTSSDKWTLALGVFELPATVPAGHQGQPIMAGALMMMVPVVLGFFVIQRWLISGVNLTGAAR